MSGIFISGLDIPAQGSVTLHLCASGAVETSNGRLQAVPVSDACWISVEERLPESGVPVIVARRSNGKRVIEQGCRSVNGWWRVYGTRVKSVTHWIPLPEAPNA